MNKDLKMNESNESRCGWIIREHTSRQKIELKNVFQQMYFA
jgi:hypothetical protein